MYYVEPMKKEVVSFRVEKTAWLRLGRRLKKFKLNRSEFLRRCIDLALIDDEFLEEIGGDG